VNKVDLQDEYNKSIGAIDDFRKNLSDQLTKLIFESGVPLGINLESRVKEWGSIAEKIDRKDLKLKTVHDLTDLIGFRIILLFKRDLDVISDLIRKNLSVISEDDKLETLNDNKFGYQSRHYIIKIPKSWLKVPSFVSCKDYKAEVQVRTLSQHIWAATSHKLQYKNEENIPVQLRRAINRASAMLEIVDLEFERILIERDGYLDDLNKKSNDNLTRDEYLNIDSLRFIASKYLPHENLSGIEPYDELMSELTLNKILKVDQLVDILKSTEKFWMDEEKNRVAKMSNASVEYWWTKGEGEDDTEARIKRGVFYTHVGLIRNAVEHYLKENNKTFRRLI
jgi:ppGpp synthetase/RelA/SpoT-type nucleotidyltranferase